MKILISNEDINEILGNATRLKLIDQVRASPYITLIFDSASDICPVDQINRDCGKMGGSWMWKLQQLLRHF
jgi:hypothetical protein